MQVSDTEVIIEGNGAESVVMIHGWPDTYRLWDGQVEALKATCRCVRFTLPGFDLAKPGHAYSLDKLVDTVRRIVEQTCGGERVTLLLHDWGCVFGYQFANHHPQLVKRVIGVDVGDAGSRRNMAELSFKAKLMIVAYQWWRVAPRWFPGRPNGALDGGAGAGAGTAARHWRGDGLPLCDALVRRRGRPRCAAPLQSPGADALLLRRAQAVHVPFDGLVRAACCPAGQSSDRPADRTLGDGAAAEGVQ